MVNIIGRDTLKKDISKYWTYVQDLVDEVGDYCIDETHEVEFVMRLYDNLDPHNVEDELTEKQLDWLIKLHQKYCRMP